MLWGFTTTADGKNMVNYDIAVAEHAFSAGYIDVSCIFVFIYLFSRGVYVGCFSKPSVSNIQTQPIKHTAGRRLFKNVDI